MLINKTLINLTVIMVILLISYTLFPCLMHTMQTYWSVSDELQTFVLNQLNDQRYNIDMLIALQKLMC